MTTALPGGLFVYIRLQIFVSASVYIYRPTYAYLHTFFKHACLIRAAEKEIGPWCSNFFGPQGPDSRIRSSVRITDTQTTHALSHARSNRLCGLLEYYKKTSPVQLSPSPGNLNPLPTPLVGPVCNHSNSFSHRLYYK
jgi:hypothetical protein